MLEISDLIVDYDVETLARRLVGRAAVAGTLRAAGQRAAARYVETLPVDEHGALEAGACDAILVRAHTELQRLSEEFLQADRLRSVLVPILRTLRASHVPPPYRIVDVGCGLGYVVRALAAHGRLGRDVEIIGCDMNAALVARASALAVEEALACEFRVANAFALEQPAHVYISTGVLHHFRDEALRQFFDRQQGAHAFVHYDMQASLLSPIGSWIFHRARMREPLSRHDGVVSARRAHPATALRRAAGGREAFVCASLDEARTLLGVIVRPMAAVLGARRELWPELVRQLGPLAARVGAPA